jgi:hypothetical protein
MIRQGAARETRALENAALSSVSRERRDTAAASEYPSHGF